MKKIIFIIPLMAVSLLTNCKTAGTCVVSFIANGGKVLSENPLVVKSGERIEAPLLEDRPGYNKDNVVWEDKSGEPFNFDTTKVTDNIVLYADWGDIATYHVTFYLNGVEYSEEDVEYNQKPHRLENPTDDFDNWYADDTYNTPFDFNEALTGEEHNINVYGRNKPIYEITITDDYGHITEQTVTFSYNDYRSIYVPLSIDAGHGLTDAIEVSPANAADVCIFDTKTIEIIPKINSNFTVTLKTEEIPAPEFYSVMTGGNEMTYYANEDLTVELKYKKVAAQKDLVFYMLAGYPNSSSNTEGYVPPTSLNITIDNIPFDDYTIEGVSGAYENIERKVTIQGKYITGDIEIIADAVPVDCYEITCPYLFGLKQPEIQDIYCNREEVSTFEFIADDDAQFTTELLTDENLYVNFTGVDGDWISPKYDKDRFTTYGSFEHKTEGNTDQYLLTIKANVIPSTTNIVKIVARTQSYPTLDALSWEAISGASEKGYAPSLFSVGDQKKIDIGGYNHSVRIVDFNRDDLADGSGKVGITFEFAHVIRGMTTCWNVKGFPDHDDNHDFTDSTLNDFCKKIYNEKIPDLKAVIKEVKKNARIYADNKWQNKEYQTYLFPLSYDEIGFGDASNAYQYYANKITDKRKKNDKYWLRNPDENGTEYAYYVDSTGISSTNQVNDSMHPHAVAPAFCI